MSDILNSYKPSLEKLLSGFFAWLMVTMVIIKNKVHCLKNNIPDPKSYWLTSTNISQRTQLIALSFCISLYLYLCSDFKKT